MTAITGMTVGLMCRAESPSATITWLKDGAPVALNGSRVQRTENGTLNLSPVEKHDGGMYQCYIENEFGEGSQSTSHLVVECKRDDLIVLISFLLLYRPCLCHRSFSRLYARHGGKQRQPSLLGRRQSVWLENHLSVEARQQGSRRVEPDGQSHNQRSDVSRLGRIHVHTVQ